jgi:hypothetical protein
VPARTRSSAARSPLSSYRALGSEPSPPASLTAMAISGVEEPAIGAWMIDGVSETSWRQDGGETSSPPPPAVFGDGQAAPAPVFELDLLDHDEGRVERLVQHVEQKLADAGDERAFSSA